MLSKKMATELNDQINAEMFSAYLYLQMAAWFESQNLKGMANWMEVQTQEEMVHAMKFFKFIQSRGGEVSLKQIKAPTQTWDSPLAAFEAALKHEQYITGRIHKLMDLAIEKKDHPSRSLLQWFVDEQVEEEENATDNVQNTKMVQDSQQGLYMLDKEMAARVFVPPADSAEAGA
jgi:ferritin